MSIIKAIRHQLGLSTTPSNNFTWDSSADNGTIRMYRGNAGTPVADILTVSATNVVTAASGAVLAPSGPAFSAFCSVAVSHTGGAASKVPLQTEEFDTANAFDNVLFRFQPLTAGYYQLNANVQVLQTGSQVGFFYKNGSAYKAFGFQPITTGNSPHSTGSCLVFLNGSSDFMELFVQPSTTGNTNAVNSITYFQGNFVRAA